MKLLHYFDAFLRDAVNLNKTRLDLLDARVDSIVAAIGFDDAVGPKLIDHVPQGSWAHRTIIKPVGDNDEFDADFLLHLEEDAGWSADPKRYMSEVYAAFRRSTDYRNMVHLKNRCVRIVYANDCHVDVVPYLVRADGSELIVNRDANAFENTNPDGFTAWMKERDELAGGNLRRVIRLLKYVRDSKNNFTCKSVILTTLVGERVRSIDAETRYSDVPTALTNIVNDLDAWLQLYPSRPSIEDPSCPGTNFDHRWDQALYANFRSWIHLYAGWITAAYDEPDRDKSLVLWQKLFGPSFKAPVAAVREASAVAAAPAPSFPTARAPNEQFIGDQYPVAITHSATIIGEALPMAGFRSGQIRNLGRLHKHRKLRFTVHTDVARPFEVLWKVRNYGRDAEAAHGLRGEIRPDNATWHTESTLYTGTHWIECYILKGGQVVASDRYVVTIQ